MVRCRKPTQYSVQNISPYIVLTVDNIMYTVYFNNVGVSLFHNMNPVISMFGIRINKSAVNTIKTLVPVPCSCVKVCTLAL